MILSVSLWTKLSAPGEAGSSLNNLLKTLLKVRWLLTFCSNSRAVHWLDVSYQLQVFEYSLS